MYIQLALILLIIANCNSNNKITQQLHNYNIQATGKSYIFVMADFDCSMCKSQLYVWRDEIKKRDTTARMYGLYCTNQIKAYTNSRYVNLTKNEITWQNTDNFDLYNLAKDKTNFEIGPFVIIIKDKKIVAIQKITEPFEIK